MPAEAAVGLATRGDWSASSACSYLVPMCGASHQLSRLHRHARHCSYEALRMLHRRREMQIFTHVHACETPGLSGKPQNSYLVSCSLDLT